MQTSKAEGGAVKANHDILKVAATVLTIVAVFVAAGIAWGTGQAQLGDMERRIATMELNCVQTNETNTEILVRLGRIETSLQYIRERVSIVEDPSAPSS